MKFLLGLLVLVVALSAGAFFYLSRPKDLGVTYADSDLKSIYGKIKVKYEPIPKEMAAQGKTIIVSGSHPVDATFTQEELTAIVDNRHKNYAPFPFRKVQIRVNNDGTVEGAATVNYKDAVNYLVAMGVAYGDIVKAAEKFKVPPVDLPVYLKAEGAIANNESNISIMSATIANIPVPGGLVDQYGPAVNDLVEMVIKERQSSYNIENLSVKDGKVTFKGTSPDIEMAVKSL